jgi:hypothetical protein
MTTINKHMANPSVTTPSGSIGTHRSDNRFAFEFSGTDPDSDPIEFVLFDTAEQEVAQVVPGLALDPSTGWLYGLIPAQTNSRTYEFLVAVRKVSNPSAISEKVPFSLEVLSSAGGFSIRWITDAALGSIENGAISTLRVQAESSSGATLEYRLASGSSPVNYQRLPQGLTLALNGSIQGRVAFIDSDFTGDFADQIREFTVVAQDTAGLVSATRTFTLVVKNTNQVPFENVYLLSLVSEQQRDLIDSVQSLAVPLNTVYRPSDPEFGIQKKLRILIATGLNPATDTDYLAALSRNHHRRPIKFSEPRLARALNLQNQVIYEVIYLRVLDDLENSQGQSVSSTISVTTGAVGLDSAYQSLVKDTEISPAATEITPNSISNMRNRIINTIGVANAGILPAWMASVQTSGQSLGWIPAAVLAYLEPGTGQTVLNNLIKSGFSSSDLNFVADRYVCDQNLSYVYDKTLEQYLDISVTTFDSNTLELDGGGTRIQDFLELSFPFRRIAPRSFEAPEKNDKYLVFPRYGVFK